MADAATSKCKAFTCTILIYSGRADLEDALGGEIEGGGGLAGAADPVDQDLAGTVLVIRQVAALPPACVGDTSSHVYSCCVSRSPKLVAVQVQAAQHRATQNVGCLQVFDSTASC